MAKYWLGTEAVARIIREDAAGTNRLRKVNVAHLVHGLEVGGVEMMVLKLVTNLNSSFRGSICCFDSLGALEKRARASGIDVQLVRRRPGIDWKYPLKLARLLREQRVDILQLHNPTAFFYGTLAGKLARTPCIIYTEHGRDVSYGWKVRMGHRVLAKLVDDIVAVGDHGKWFLRTKEKIDSRKITKIYNGVDPAPFDARCHVENRAEIRRSAGLENGFGPVIGIVARLDPIKNHAALFRAMKLVVSKLPGATLLVIGEGSHGRALRTLVEDMKLRERIRFLGSREDIPELFSIMDLFVLPSVSEGLSMTLIEACAAAKPIVATDVGGNSEVVDHGENGLLVQSDDWEALANAILEILSDRDKAREMGIKARLKFEQRFTLQAMVENYERLYRKHFSSSDPAEV